MTAEPEATSDEIDAASLPEARELGEEIASCSTCNQEIAHYPGDPWVHTATGEAFCLTGQGNARPLLTYPLAASLPEARDGTPTAPQASHGISGARTGLTLPPVAWLDGKPIAWLDALPHGTHFATIVDGNAYVIDVASSASRQFATTPVIVVAWADGSTPTPSAAPAADPSPLTPPPVRKDER